MEVAQSSAEMIFKFPNEDVRFLTFPDEKNGNEKISHL